MAVKSRRQERGEVTRAALLAAAEQLFGAHGYAGTSLDDVVATAGVTKGAFYHHFTDKQQLFAEVVAEVKRTTTARLSELFVDEEPFATLVLGCEAILDAYLDPAVRQIVWVDARAVLPGQLYAELQARYEPVFIRASLRRAMRSGAIEAQPLRPLAALLTGAIGEACLLVAGAADQRAARDEVVRTLTRLLEGLRPSTGRAGPAPAPASAPPRAAARSGPRRARR